jgi:hypothetical protein
MLILKPLSIDWSVAGAKIPAVTFIAQAGLPARELAHMLDSLVRVSRRVEKNHLVIVVVSERCPRQPNHNLSECLGLEAKRQRTLKPNTRDSVHRCVLPSTFTPPERGYQVLGVFLNCELTLTHMARTTAHVKIKTRHNTCVDVTSNHRSTQQSHQDTLVPFASHSAISGTFNSLFKVLFIFPSWYLFAIGLEPIFSLR